MVVDYCQECGCSACQCGGSTSGIVPSWPDVADRWMKACMEHDVTIADLRAQVEMLQYGGESLVSGMVVIGAGRFEQLRLADQKLADLRERLRVAETEKKCGWWDDGGTWASVCGVYYTFINDDGPEGNGHEFCIRCGGRVVVTEGQDVALCDAELGKEGKWGGIGAITQVVGGEVMAAHNTFWVSPEQKIDRLIKQISDAQSEIAVAELEADKAKARIATLEAEKADSILRMNQWAANTMHTCHEQCERPLCAANRRIAELEARCAKYKAVIDRAPHHESCGFWVGMFKKHCDCWKKAALTEGGEHG